MNLRFKPSLVTWFFTIVFPISLAFLFWQIILFSYPLDNASSFVPQSTKASQIFKVSELFSRAKITNQTKQNNQVTSNSSIKSMRLKGIYKDESRAFAIIEVKGETLFPLLEEKIEGYVLEEVNKDNIVLSKLGEYFSIYLDKEDNEAGEDSQLSIQSKFEKMSANKISREELRPYQSDIQRIWQSIRLRPVKKGNIINGYKITYLNNKSLFSRIGLKRNDTIMRVNGVEMTKISDIVQLYSNLDTFDFITVVINRNNEEKELQYELF